VVSTGATTVESTFTVVSAVDASGAAVPLQATRVAIAKIAITFFILWFLVKK
jgi:hypothetical protein